MTSVDFLSAAASIARRIVSSADWHGDECTWQVVVPEIDGNGMGPRRRVADGCVYQGTAGIALFLLELHALTYDADVERTAMGALRFAARRDETGLGFHTGRVGVAYALALAAMLTGHDECWTCARDIVRGLAGRERTDRLFDVVHGAAGAIVPLLRIASWLGLAEARESAIAFGVHLMESANRRTRGWSWPSPPSQSARDLCGYSHGASGCGHALIELYAATGDASFLYAGVEAFNYEASNYDEKCLNWPDYRNPRMSLFERDQSASRSDGLRWLDDAGDSLRYAPHFVRMWCHGAPGIALARLRAYELTGDPSYAAQARTAIETTKPTLVAGMSGYSLCHGVMGNAEALLMGATVLGEPAWRAAAESAAADGMERFESVGLPWPSGCVASAPDPSLLVGDAGIGLFLLRLHDGRIPSPLLVTNDVHVTPVTSPALSAEVVWSATRAALASDVATAMRDATAPAARAEFFVLRTPLLPFDRFSALAADLRSSSLASDDAAEWDAAVASDWLTITDRLRAEVRSPAVREALFVASPSLEAALDGWLVGTSGDRERAVTMSVARYLARAAGRATPFGLFAGCSVGRVVATGDTALALSGRPTRRTRFDGYYLAELASVLSAQAEIQAGLRFRPNATLHRVGGRVHFVQVRSAKAGREYFLTAAGDSAYLDVVLEAANHGASLDQLVACVVEQGVDPEPARAYVDDLVAAQVIVSDLEPALTATQPIDDLLGQLDACGGAVAANVTHVLGRAAVQIAALDQSDRPVAPDAYRLIAAQLRGLPADPRIDRLFQVDVFTPVPDARLGGDVVATMLEAASLIQRISCPFDALDGFKKAFRERYDRAEIPLLEALDDEVGIGLPASAPAQTPRTSTARQHAALADLVIRAVESRSIEILLTDHDVAALEQPKGLSLPGAFAVMATVVGAGQDAVARGEFRVLMHPVSGPSGATLLGRFCHLDETLHDYVATHVRAEEGLLDGGIAAEIVHLPGGRAGNVVCRPRLRDYVIPVLGRGGDASACEIALSDLSVSLAGDELVLRSRRLGRRVAPRLTTAHNYAHPANLPVYRFLGLMQREGTHCAAGWSWQLLDDARFLPRVVYGRAVLSRAAWTVGASELEIPRDASDGAVVRATRRWREMRGVPRLVLAGQSDHLLPIDFESPVSIMELRQLLAKQSRVRLTELYPGPDELVVAGEAGRYVHEVVVPFVRTTSTPPKASSRPTRHAEHGGRAFSPLSEWLYLKVYLGPGNTDRFLRELAPIVQQATDTGIADRWFFVRYVDPEPHLRLRVHGEPARLRSELVPALQGLADRWLAARVCWRVQYDTYQREVERYGGDEGMDVAEAIFHIDSAAAIRLIDAHTPGRWAAMRETIALRSIDGIASAVGMSERDRLALYTALVGVSTAAIRQRWAKTFRAERNGIQHVMLDAPDEAMSDYARAASVLDRRDAELRVIGERFAVWRRSRAGATADDVIGSHLHMACNRLGIRPEAERERYEMLRRHGDSRLARRRAAEPVA